MQNRKTVLITGASRGIGKAAAEIFAEAGGYNIVIVSHHSENELKINAALLSGCLDTGCLAIPGDIADEAFVKTLFREIDSSFSGLDILINCAGIALIRLIQETSASEWDNVMSTNLKSVFLCTKEAIPLMLRKHAGSIVNISSVWGNVGGACESAYSASKGGINSFTKAAAKELAPSGIRVNAVAYGVIDTAMNGQLSPDEKEALTGEIPLGRMGTPEEAAYLAYETAVKFTYMTGQILTLDGGWT